MKMRVLQLIDSLEPGGAERMAVNLANALAEDNVFSCICATRAEGALKSTINKSVNYLFLNRKYVVDVIALIRLVKFVKTSNISIIHAHGSSFFFAWLLKLRLPNLKLIWHDHNGNRSEVKGLFPRLLKLCSSKFDAVLCVNDNLKHWIQTNLKASNLHVIQNFPMLSLSEHTTILKGEKGKRILCLANLRHPKNHLLLLESFKDLCDKFSGWTLHIVGKDYNDDYSNAVKEFINSEKLSNSVFIYDSCNDTSNIISQVEIGVLSSNYEGLPMTLLEYGLGGLAVIVTNVGDNSKVIINDEFGHLIPVKNPKALTESLLFYVGNEEDRIAAGKRLKLHVQNNFSKKSALKKIIDVYLSLNNS
ncbi:glycosyltransferase family 4 protein [Winogradskyella endarachnes]|uniref:Glycosyltransferase n=1 Tax=Winogradskyella endarachnes TaxID=2681965 RepID=A0A6L6U9N8_9FLAO|nr:glycosyltransferase family 4 protein [Winogradskyella endarachnes]MUU77642.1 glycosyltransferase [Winogradskyella endarachnes]